MSIWTEATTPTSTGCTGKYTGRRCYATHHDLHHQGPRWNFGLYFTLWDRLMGTEHPDYVIRFEAAATADILLPSASG